MNGTVLIPVVFTEKVDDMSFADIKKMFGRVPDWVSSVDCGQVGVNRKGKLVAYDYGIR